jgi:hypothetical protein
MTEPDLNSLADQNDYLLSELRDLRDDIKRLQTRVSALKAQHDVADALAVFRSAVVQSERRTDLGADRMEPPLQARR